MSRSRRRFTPENKDEAVKLVIDSGRPVSAIAKDLDINECAMTCRDGSCPLACIRGDLLTTAATWAGGVWRHLPERQLAEISIIA